MMEGLIIRFLSINCVLLLISIYWNKVEKQVIWKMTGTVFSKRTFQFSVLLIFIFIVIREGVEIEKQ